MKTADLTIPAAKPYEGEAQWRNIRHAIKRWEDAGLITTEPRYSYRLSAKVNSRGSKYYGKGEDWYSADVAHLTLIYPRLPDHLDTSEHHRKEAKATAEKFVAALREAGWTLEPLNGYSGSEQYYVYGPGLEAWVKQCQANGRAARKAAAEQEARQRAEHDALMVFLTEHGLDRAAQRITWDPTAVRATLTLADLKVLVGEQAPEVDEDE